VSVTEDARRFLGRGWAFPVAVDATGEIATAVDEEDIRQAVLIILATDHDERVMRPDFGANLTATLFDPITTTTAALLRHRVELALVEWEPRIDSVDVDVTPDPRQGRIDIRIRYRVRATNSFYNLVYPFYVAEATS
jgi:phage baseplate assembly protein W